MYAIVEIAGQQFKVSEKQEVFVNRIDSKEGSKIILDKVLLLDKDGKIEVGVPTLERVGVTAKIVEHLKSDKVLGELKDSQSQFDEKTVLLNEKLFSQSFGSILSTLTHELQHAFGLADGQRAFSDGLTILLKIMIDHPEKLKLFKNDWEKYRII